MIHEKCNTTVNRSGPKVYDDVILGMHTVVKVRKLEGGTGMDKTTSMGFEYFSAEVPRSYEAIYNDCYLNLGWQPAVSQNVISSSPNPQGDSVRLQYKRQRGIRGHGELGSIQTKCETLLKAIRRAENKSDDYAVAASLGLGVIGAALITGAIFCLLNAFYIAFILLLLPGIAGCAAAYPANKRVRQKIKEQTTPTADKHYDELYNLFVKARQLSGYHEE